MIKTFRLGLVTAAVSAFILTAQSSASAVTVPPLPYIPASGLPVVGGFVDSLVGIATGSYYGAAAATFAVLNSLGLPI
jgi:hypothetical protein